MDNTAEDPKKKKPPTITVRTQEGEVEEYPEKPGVMDYVKEAFKPTSTRASIDAVRRRREKYGQS